MPNCKKCIYYRKERKGHCDYFDDSAEEKCETCTAYIEITIITN